MKDTNTLVIRLNKTYILFVLIAALSYMGGYLTHSRFVANTTQNTDSLAQGALTNPDPVQPQVLPVNTDDDPFLGPLDAPVTIVEFSDFQCPFCKKFHDQTLSQLLETYSGKVRYIYRDFPLYDIHPSAQKAAEAAECADEQGQFWPMHDQLFAMQNSWASAPDATQAFKGYAQGLKLNVSQFNECLDSSKYTREVQGDLEDGVSYGINGTPAFFINGFPISGAQPLSVFKEVIERELAKHE